MIWLELIFTTTRPIIKLLQNSICFLYFCLVCPIFNEKGHCTLLFRWEWSEGGGHGWRGAYTHLFELVCVYNVYVCILCVCVCQKKTLESFCFCIPTTLTPPPSPLKSYKVSLMQFLSLSFSHFNSKYVFVCVFLCLFVWLCYVHNVLNCHF